MRSPTIRIRRRCPVLLHLALASALGLGSIASAQTVVAPVNERLREPARLKAVNGLLDQPLDAVFGQTSVNTPNGNAEITVRAYAPGPTAKPLPKVSLPGPTFVFRPGDLVRIRFENQLNATANPALNVFDNNIQAVGGAGGFDDIRDHAAHEISIPNDSNVTNLHVHGLHVDPKQDNVTLLILPKDYSPGNLSPELQRFVPNINRWWTRAYQYKIPADHIPGTYWYHSHKHGSTSTQVENGMAGTLVMLPRDPQDDIIPGISGTDRDRVLMIQELQNYGPPPNVGGAFAPRLANAAGAGTGPGSRKGGGGGKNKAGKGPGSLRALSNNNVTLPTNAAGSTVTVNGQYQPALPLPAGQIERWRFILAGANHTAAGSLWVGKYLLPPRASLPAAFVSAVQAMTTVALANAYTSGSTPTVFPADAVVPIKAQVIPGDVKLVSVDGIPMRAPVDISPANPTLGGAGNRFDIFIRPSAAATASGPYFVYQNYPAPTPAQMAAAYPDLFGPSVDQSVPGLAAARYAAVTTGATTKSKANPHGFAPAQPLVDTSNVFLPNSAQTDFYALGSNYQGFTQPWYNVDDNGNPLVNSAGVRLPPTTMPIGPLLRARLRLTSKGVEIEEPKNDAANAFPNGGRWQPMPDKGDGAPPTAAVLLVVNTSGPAVMPTGPDPMAGLAARVSSLSPAGTGSALKRVNKLGQLVPGIPAYVAPLTGPVDGHQVAVFDRGQFTFDYTDKVTGTLQQFRQFWISGRQFNIDDTVGNPESTALIQTPLINVEPSLGRYNPAAAANAWSHQIAAPVGAGGQPKILVTNPGYFRPIKTYVVEESPGKVSNVYNYAYDTYVPPTAATLSGIETRPAPPKSRTSEEWVLINNSDLYHPFHIHISPFFVEEVGQLNYTAGEKDAKGTWSLNRTKWDGTKAVSYVGAAQGANPKFGWVVGSWWDVIMLPPHGYVRMKTWINVPDQVPVKANDHNSDLAVVDNSNTYGSWVFHCHILRHEDRGMMSMVNTVPNPVVLGPAWYDNQQGSSPVQYTVTDSHGALKVQPPASGGILPAAIRGTFNQGLGNPFISQPYAGAVNFTTAAGVVAPATFCATEDAQLLVFSNGTQWSTSASAPAYSPPPATPVYIDLTGTWTDDTETRNKATITQTKSTNSSGVVTGSLNVVPVAAPGVWPVWWNGASGSWIAGGVGVTPPTPNLNYGGALTFAVTQAGQVVRDQFMNFCVTSDGKKIVFGNGITWTRN